MTEVMRLLVMSVRDLLDEWFENAALKGLLGSAGVRGLTQGPFASGTTFNLLHHLAIDDGYFRATAKGGVGAICRALAAAARARLSARTALDADSLLRMARTRRDAGDASELEVELARINAGQLTNAAVGDSLLALSALQDLQALMGMPYDRPLIALADSLAVPSADTVPSARITVRVAEAEAQLSAQEYALVLERRRVLGAPAMRFGIEGGDPAGEERGVLPLFGVALPLPFFNRNRGEIALAAANRDRARAELEAARRESDAAIARAYRVRRAALERARRDRELLGGAERVARMALTAYAEGAVALPYVLEVQRNAREARGQFIDDVAAAAAADAAVRFSTVAVGGAR
jgi:cobalt-zinc-cadmium efflux system outer membrane protein